MSQFFYVDVDAKFAIFSYTENVKSHFFTQNMKFSNKTGNVARDLKKRPKYLKKHPFHTYKRKKHVALLFRLRCCIFGRPILKQNIVAKKCSIFDGSWTFQPIIPKLCFRARFVSSSLGWKVDKLLFCQKRAFLVHFWVCKLLENWMKRHTLKSKILVCGWNWWSDDFNFTVPKHLIIVTLLYFVSPSLGWKVDKLLFRQKWVVLVHFGLVSCWKSDPKDTLWSPKFWFVGQISDLVASTSQFQSVFFGSDFQ